MRWPVFSASLHGGRDNAILCHLFYKIANFLRAPPKINTLVVRFQFVDYREPQTFQSQQIHCQFEVHFQYLSMLVNIIFLLHQLFIIFFPVVAI
jgi:hypothetical protein